jgi:predicted RNA-binding protein YlxR (DUF448 family)
MNITTKKNKSSPQRRCVITHEQCDKQSLLRIVRDQAGVVHLDPSGKINGRGAYIKRDITLITKLKKSNVLGKHLHVTIPEAFYETLTRYLKDGKQD